MAMPEALRDDHYDYSRANLTVVPNFAESGVIPVEPTRDEVVSHMQLTAAETALVATLDIRNAYQWGPITSEAREQLEVDLDVNATPVMEAMIHQADFRSKVVGTEGAKERRKYGRELPDIKGPYGFGKLLKIEDRHIWTNTVGLGDVEMDLDPIEGTKKASYNVDGAVVMSGGSIKGGLPEIPGEETPALYNDRKIASPRVANLINERRLFNLSETDLALLTADAYGVDITDVEVVVLNRPRNAGKIKSLTELGVKLRLIEDGDLIPALSVLTSDKPMLSVGGGGKEEAAIASFAAKALDGYFEGQYVGINGERLEDYPEVLTLDDMAPGDKENYFVVFASITGVKELGIDRPTHVPALSKNAHNMPVATITSEQPYIQRGMIGLKAA